MTKEEEILIEKVIWLIEDSYPDTNEWGHDILCESIKEDLKRRADELNNMWPDAHPKNLWHKVADGDLPKMKHFTTDGDFSDLCLCVNESMEHKILVLCSNSEYTYWSYGYDGEGLYDEDYDGGKITHWMEIPEVKED